MFLIHRSLKGSTARCHILTRNTSTAVALTVLLALNMCHFGPSRPGRISIARAVLGCLPTVHNYSALTNQGDHVSAVSVGQAVSLSLGGCILLTVANGFPWLVY